jgi:hypothetical protein
MKDLKKTKDKVKEEIKDTIIEGRRVNNRSESTSTKCKPLRNISFKFIDFKTHNITVKADHNHFQFP